jgi:hypothetical protein
LPPPPLTAPTPSKVRPAEEPLMVIAVAASAGAATPTTPVVASRQLRTSAVVRRSLAMMRS